MRRMAVRRAAQESPNAGGRLRPGLQRLVFELRGEVGPAFYFKGAYVTNACFEPIDRLESFDSVEYGDEFVVGVGEIEASLSPNES